MIFLKIMANENDTSNKLKRFINYLSWLTKFCLSFSSFSLILSILLYVIFTPKLWEKESLPAVVAWYSLFVSLYSMFYGLISIIVLAVYYRYKQLSIWKSIKKETVLFILSIVLFFILVLTIKIISSIDKPL